jgi:hypothetical protein
MSAIIDKVYDATKRIYKSVFKGAPNLITTADLNRQMSAFQAQLENLYRFVGPITDLSFTFEQNNENPSFSASYTLSKMVARGCDFTNLLPASGTLSGDLPVTANERLWVLLTATQKLVTYADDPSHDIAGAKFSDGTTYPAADQIVYETASLVTSPDNYDSVENVVEALGYFYRDSSTPRMVKFMPNFVPLKTLYTGHMFPASPQMTLPQAIAANTLTDGSIPAALNVGMGSTFNVALKKFYDKYSNSNGTLNTLIDTINYYIEAIENHISFFGVPQDIDEVVYNNKQILVRIHRNKLKFNGTYPDNGFIRLLMGKVAVNTGSAVWTFGIDMTVHCPFNGGKIDYNEYNVILPLSSNSYFCLKAEYGNSTSDYYEIILQPTNSSAINNFEEGSDYNNTKFMKFIVFGGSYSHTALAENLTSLKALKADLENS